MQNRQFVEFLNGKFNVRQRFNEPFLSNLFSEYNSQASKFVLLAMKAKHAKNNRKWIKKLNAKPEVNRQ